MRRSTAKIALVSMLFAASFAVQVFLYPASRSPLLTVLYIVPVTLAALFWGMIPGLLVGLAATAATVALEMVIALTLSLNVAVLGLLFFTGVGALLGHMSDMTRADRRRAASLDAARARLASVLSAAKDAVITIDPQGRVTSWNAAAQLMFGWSEEEVLGRNLHELVAGPAHRGGTGTQVPAFPRPDESHNLHTTIEMEGMRRDGSVFPAELSLASFQEGVHRHAVGIVRDISERRRNEARYQRLFQTVPVGLYRTKLDGTILDANQAMVEMLGYPDRETLLVRNAASLYAESGARERMIQLTAREPAFHGDVRLLAYDGSTLTCLMSVRAERGPDGQVIQLEGSLRDVTKMRQLEGMRRQSERLEAIDALASGIAHDFSNILAGIRGFGEHLTRSADASVSALSRRIVEAVDRADRITADLMAVMGDRAHRAQRITLDELCRGACGTLGPGVAGIVDYQPQPDPVAVVVDSEAIASAIRELVQNAVQASPVGAPILARTGTAVSAGAGVLGPAADRPGPWAWISIADHGSGMDEATRERIFEPYFTTKPFGTGSGLGLVRVLGLLRQHGGGIGVASTPGQGTTMTIYLPRAPDVP